ncbi:MAG: alpha/beta fold hydrolase [Mycobacterium leprae]
MEPTFLKRPSPLYYRESGEGRPLVLLHGLGSDHRIWDRTGRQLGASHRLFAPDLPGHGHSPRLSRYGLDQYVAAIADWLDALDLGPVPVVGHSWGGTIALALALSRPELVSWVGAVCPVWLFGTTMPRRVQYRFMAFGAAQAFRKPSGGATRRFLRHGMGVTAERITPSLVRLWQESSVPSTGTVFRTFRQLRRSRAALVSELDGVHCPVWFAWGRQEPLCPTRSQVEQLLDELPEAKVAFMETGHLPMFEAAEEFGARLEAELP